MNSIIRTVPADTVEFFHNFLRRSSGSWLGPSGSWIFRGQRKSTWKLRPSIFRQKVIGRWPELNFEGPIESGDFIERELALLRRFVKVADSVALKVPGDRYEFRIKENFGTAEWPPIEYMEIFAIA
jgi:hypothetical protein